MMIKSSSSKTMFNLIFSGKIFSSFLLAIVIRNTSFNLILYDGLLILLVSLKNSVSIIFLFVYDLDGVNNFLKKDLISGPYLSFLLLSYNYFVVFFS